MDLMTAKAAAEYLKMSPQTLAGWRHKRTGPRFMRTGRVIKYAKEDLDSYLKNNRVKTKNEKEK